MCPKFQLWRLFLVWHSNSSCFFKGSKLLTYFALLQWCRRLGCRECKGTPKSYYLPKIQAKYPNIWAKSLKIWAKSRKIRANLAPNVVWFQIAEKQIKTFCLKIIPKKGLHDLCGREKICRQTSHKNISGKFGRIQAKSFEPPKICLLLQLRSAL